MPRDTLKSQAMINCFYKKKKKKRSTPPSRYLIWGKGLEGQEMIVGVKYFT